MSNAMQVTPGHSRIMPAVVHMRAAVRRGLRAGRIVISWRSMSRAACSGPAHRGHDPGPGSRLPHMSSPRLAMTLVQICGTSGRMAGRSPYWRSLGFR